APVRSGPAPEQRDGGARPVRGPHGGRVMTLVGGLLIGCGPGNGLTLGRVRGTVTYKGKPVQNGFVTFQPDASHQTDGPPAMGTINQDGSYALTTQDADDGAVVGTHKVAILGL